VLNTISDAQEEVSPLLYAVMAGRTACAQVLIAAGVSFNAPSQTYGSCLTGSSIHGFFDASIALIRAGANVDEVDADGYTILMNAAMTATVTADHARKLCPIVEALLQAGADASVIGPNGHIAHEVAESVELQALLADDVDAASSRPY
jgi:ankyrin repeat protein